ncbi:hypothetical protein MMC30_008073 [Trapelia coarctata]|nr:hypothetical protein [Trapelia coarctata]
MATSSSAEGSQPPRLKGETSSDHASAKEDDDPPAKSPPRPMRIWSKLGLNYGVLSTMFKGACPPVIATALYQATPFAETFSTLGYLVAIMSILSFAIMPRSKFFQTMIFNLIGVCIGAAVALLTIYCSVQARINTTPVSTATSVGPTPGTAVAQYNSSASAVCGIWLFFNILFANALRFSRPQLQFPVIIYSIFANVACTYAPLFATVTQGIAFIKQLLEAFLAGFGIAAAVNLFIFPKSSRDVVLAEAGGYIQALQGVLKAQNGYLQILERKEIYRPADKEGSDEPPPEASAAKAFKGALAALTALHGKLQGDLVFAKREVAYSKLDAKDLDQIFKLFREIFLPLLGMGSVVDIFDRIAKKRGWKEAEEAEDSHNAEEVAAERERKDKEIAQWNEIMKTLHDSFEIMCAAMVDGLQHASYVLSLAKRPKMQQSDQETDLEAADGAAQPGDIGFGDELAAKIASFYKQREVPIKTWCAQKGIEIDSTTGTEHPAVGLDTDEHSRNERQLYLILYMEFLLWSTGKGVLDLVRFADAMVESGATKKRKLILPGRKRIRKWVMNAFHTQDGTTDLAPDHTKAGISGVYLGALYQKRKDPEHLPPSNSWQLFGNYIQAVSHILSSPEQFFFQQRLVWAMIMVAIGMTMTAGSGTFGLIGRVGGTFIAVCTSLVIWYIAGGTGVPAGVFVLLFFFLFIQTYFLIAFPKFAVVVMITMVTQVLILGYELQVKKVGIVAAEATGQPYYPIYLLAPYRLACVAGGCFVAFFWTFFPYPITARSTLRKQLGESLYLLANYYSCVHTTVRVRLNGTGGDPDDKQSPRRRLDKARERILAKELALFAQIRQHSASTAFEPTFGGKFPKEQYDTIIQETQNILNYMALIGYATRHYTKETDSPTERKWVNDFGRVLGSVQVTSQEVTSLIALLSASVMTGSPLPPYLKAPASYQLSAKLEKIDASILSISHIIEPGYAAFAVTQVASSLINDDLENLLTNIKSLVGEVDFDFHIVSSADSSDTSLPATDKGKRD